MLFNVIDSGDDFMAGIAGVPEVLFHIFLKVEFVCGVRKYGKPHWPRSQKRDIDQVKAYIGKLKAVITLSCSSTCYTYCKQL